MLCDQSAHRYARERVEERKYRLEHRPTDILEIDIDAFRAGFFQFRRQVRIAVVDTVIEAEFAFDVVAFFPAARDTDRARSLDPGNLPDGRADRAGRRRYHHRFARLRLADIQ